MTVTSETVMERELRPWNITALDIEECSRVEFTIGLLSDERAGQRPETWPDEPRRRLDVAISGWLARNDVTAIRAVSYGAVKHEGHITLVVVLHHLPPSTAQSAKSAEEAAPPAFEPPAAPVCQRAGCAE